MESVGALHALAGVLHLAPTPIIDVAAAAELVHRWGEVNDLDASECDDETARRRDIRAAFAAIVDQASRCCLPVERASSRVAGEVEDTGRPSPASLVALSESAAVLVAEPAGAGGMTNDRS